MKRTIPMLILALALVGASGCIRSYVDISTNPSGAEVIVNNRPRGRSPVRVPFIWYWYYEIRVEKEGYEPLKAVERWRSPVWAIFPLDFFAEAIPIPIHDRRFVVYELKPLSEE